MLSLIICSRTPRLSSELEKNIAETIGCEYELVIIDNSKNSYSIFSAYNEGVKRAQGSVLCFMHDDILYKTKDWGIIVEHILKDESIGIVGVIGSYVMTKDYGYWDMMDPFVTGYVPCGDLPENNSNLCFDEKSSNEVAIVDGMWFCMPKKIFSKVSFDVTTYHGYHFYDMDICMQSLMAGYKNVVIRDCIIQHNCHPNMDIHFAENMNVFFNKWNSKLPVFCGEALGMEEKKYDRLYNRTKLFYQLLYKATRYEYNYLSVLNSRAYKLGVFLLKPIYWLKGVTNK